MKYNENELKKIGTAECLKINYVWKKKYLELWFDYYLVIPAAESSVTGMSACLHLLALIRLSKIRFSYQWPMKSSPNIKLWTRRQTGQNDQFWVRKIGQDFNFWVSFSPAKNWPSHKEGTGFNWRTTAKSRYYLLFDHGEKNSYWCNLSKDQFPFGPSSRPLHYQV